MEKAQTSSRLDLAREVLQTEADAILALSRRLNGDFRAVDAILACTGRIVVTGMGKSGHVGRKIAATLASTGSPAFFVHPAEAAHGDLGMITAQDVVIALSNSGESGEVVALLPALKRKGLVLIGMTGNPASSLGREADILLDTQVEKKPARWAWPPPPAPRCRLPWAMPWPSPCWMRASLARKTLPCPTPAAAWGVACWSMSKT
jgi:arabinose-5-phosphate isomerase